MKKLCQQQVPFRDRRKYEELKKCGEISASVDGSVVGLCCFFCDGIFLKLDGFLSHILGLHKAEMIDLYAASCSAAINVQERQAEKLGIYVQIKQENDLDITAEELKMLAENCDVAEDKENEKVVKEEEDQKERMYKSEVMVEVEEVLPNEDLTAASRSYEKTTDPLEAPSYVGNNNGITFKKEDHNHLFGAAKSDKEELLLIRKEESKSDTEPDSQVRTHFKSDLNNLHFQPQISDLDDDDDVGKCSEVPSTKLHSENLSEIAIIYKQYSCLWDLDTEESRDKARRSEAEKQMLQQINQELQTQHTIIELKKRLSTLRRIFSKEKRHRMKMENSSKPFKPNNPLYNVLKFLEHSVGPFKCKECAALIPSHDKFHIHKAAHAGVMPFVCKICGKGMNFLGNLQIHMRRHTGEAQFLCSYCGKGFPSSFDLNLHMNSHADACNYVCDVCGKAFSRQKFLDRHMLKHDPQNKDYKCTVCSKAFLQKYKYQEHMNSHLNIRKCVCQICGKGFFSMKTLYQHKKTHAEKKPYKCTICRKDYARSESYYKHMKATHSLEKKDIK